MAYTMADSIRFGRYRSAFYIIIMICGLFFKPDPGKCDTASELLIKTQTPFIKNEGQMHPRVKFYTYTPGVSIFIRKDGTLRYSMAGMGRPVILDETFENGHFGKNNRPEGLEPSSVKIGYFSGQIKKNTRSDIPSFNRVNLGRVAEGIHLQLVVHDGKVEKIFSLDPGADPHHIRGTIHHIKRLRIGAKGELEVIKSSDIPPISFTKPVAWQVRKDGSRAPVEIGYKLYGKKSYGLTAGKYDTTLPMMIDPLLASTFIGSGNYASLCVAEDDTVYVAVSNFYGDYEGTADTDRVHGNLVVRRFSSDFSTLISSTFVGIAADAVLKTALGPDGSLYIAGSTDSESFPLSPDAFQTVIKDTDAGYEAFVVRLSADLSTFLAGTLLTAPKSYDRVTDLEIATDGSVYVTGRTNSGEFPTTDDAFDTFFEGKNCEIDYPGYAYQPQCDEGFVVRLDGNLTTLIAGTLVGGSDVDQVNAISVTNDGRVYVAGHSRSSDIPGKENFKNFGQVAGSEYSGSKAVVVQFDQNLSKAVAGAFINGNWDVHAYDLLAGNDGSIFVSGTTVSSDFPVTQGVIDASFEEGVTNAWLCRFNKDLSSLPAATYMGEGSIGFLAPGPDGSLFMAGSFTLPTSSDAFSHFMNNLFIANVNSSLTAILAGTYFGGPSNSNKNLSEISVNADFDIHLIGTTRTVTGFPVTESAYKGADDVRSGESFLYSNVFMSKLDKSLKADADDVFPKGTRITGDLRLGAMVDTVEKGFLEAIWIEGGRETTARGDEVIWGYFYTDPTQISWGSRQNPDAFVKIWFDVRGILYINYVHFSVPDIWVYSNYPASETYTLNGILTTDQRYVQHLYSTSDVNKNFRPYSKFYSHYENASQKKITSDKNPSGHLVLDDLTIAAVIYTEPTGRWGETVPIEASWRLGGTSTTERGDRVLWGFFYADPRDVTWGSRENPDLFVKVWFDQSGRVDVNYFHVSVPDIDVFSAMPKNGGYSQVSKTVEYFAERYIRHEFQK